MSIHHNWETKGQNSDPFIEPETTLLSTCNAMNPASHDPGNFYSLDTSKSDTVVYTYDVKWEKSELKWANRWDTYILASNSKDKVHWFAITNSIMIVLFLTVIIGMYNVYIVLFV